METDTKIFYGTEVEGMWRGFRTAFVPASILSQVAGTTALDHYTGTHIYLGAGSDRITTKQHWSIAETICTEMVQFDDRCFTIETSLDEIKIIPAWAMFNPRIRLIVAQAVTQGARLLHNQQVELKIYDEESALIYSNPQLVSLAYNSDSEDA